MNFMEKSVEIELSESGSNLYVFFGGIAAGIAMPVFEFYNASKILDDHKIFIRDLDQCWYQNGLQSISNNVYSTAEYIKNQIKCINARRVFFVGNSMGGYAAILFSCFVRGVDVIAFAPQTFISPNLLLKHRDLRWGKQILKTYKKSLLKRKVLDLRPLLLCSGYEKKISVFVSKEDRLDCNHASHIKGIQGVNIYEFSGGGHGIVKSLRDQGLLPAIMTGAYA